MDSNHLYQEQPGTEPDNNDQGMYQNNDVYQSGSAYQQGNAYQSGDTYQQSAYQNSDAYQQGAYQSGDAYQQGNTCQNNDTYRNDGTYQPQPGYSQYGQNNGYNNNYNNGNYNNGNPYHADLVRIERHLFNRAYLNDNNETRLNRIEKKLFNQTYSNMSIAQRMNNALANYRGEDYSSNNYYAQNNAYYPQNTMRNRLINTFVGQPTGFTPSITNSSYINRFGPSYNRGYYGTNGWGYHNSYHPTMTGAGIHILD